MQMRPNGTWFYEPGEYRRLFKGPKEDWSAAKGLRWFMKHMRFNSGGLNGAGCFEMIPGEEPILSLDEWETLDKICKFEKTVIAAGLQPCACDECKASPDV